MSPASRRGNDGGSMGRLFSRIRHRFRRSPRPHIDHETLRRLDAPAKLYVWQPEEPSEEGTTYQSLREAIRHIPEGAEDSTFIITENGHIMRPMQIAELKNLLKTLE